MHSGNWTKSGPPENWVWNWNSFFLIASIVSIHSCGAETWTVSLDMKKLDNFGTSCYRIMVGVNCTDRVRNDTILAEVQWENLSQVLQRRQPGVLGHWIRQGQYMLVGWLALFTPANGKKPRGWPRLDFKRHIENVTGVNREQLAVGRADPQPPDK